jgi:hypothetical protein
VILNFQPQFVPFVVEGSKTHTIRALRKDGKVPKVGEICHCYRGLRQKGAELLGRWPCVRVEQIRIVSAEPLFSVPAVWVGDVELDSEECEALARRDGFSSFTEMAKFWDGRLPFAGHVIHWRFKS